MHRVYSKTIIQELGTNSYTTAFARFFKHQSAFPNFKKKGKSDVKMYFVKNNPKDCRCERHRLNIPTLGWVLPLYQSSRFYRDRIDSGYICFSSDMVR